MKYIRGIGWLLVWFCVGTLLAQAVLVGVLWWNGAFADGRLTAMYAALLGIDPRSEAGSGPADSNPEPLSLTEIAQRRMLTSLDLDLRERALDQGLVELRRLREEIAVEDQRLDQWKQTFDSRLEKMEGTALDAGLLEVQRTLSAIQPKQAKEQILKMLVDGPSGQGADAMPDVVTILKSMPLDKRRKILGEFTSADEAAALAKILQQIRQGAPEAGLIHDTRASLHSEPRR